MCEYFDPTDNILDSSTNMSFVMFIYNDVVRRFDGNRDIIVKNIQPDSWCFTVIFPNTTTRVSGMSIMRIPTGIIYIGLIDQYNRHIHVDDIGYFEPKQFSTSSQICDEVTRVMKLVSTNNK
jgi:hypothetical protein